ncbi:unnamed protein product [Ectocarpus sp. 8 AP-2014]
MVMSGYSLSCYVGLTPAGRTVRACSWQCAEKQGQRQRYIGLFCASCAVKKVVASGMIGVRRDDKYTGLVNKLRVGLHFYGGGRLSVSCMEWQLHALPFFAPSVGLHVVVVACRWCICISLPSPERACPRTVTFTTRY